MVGGTDFTNNKVNLALGKGVEVDGTLIPGGGSGRGAGSSAKPFVLAEALREGLSLNSKFNAPGSMTFPGVPGARAGEDWKVSNYGGTEQGVLDLVDATRVSSNTAYAQLMLEVGAQDVADLTRRLGVSAELPVVPALVLGSGDVSPLDMAVAYSTFANRGVHNDPILIAKIEQVRDGGGVAVIKSAVPSGDRVLSDEEADQVTYCLQQVVTDGTGKSASYGKPVAGKTGTTQDNKDAWFVGYTPKLSAAVWVGYPDPLPDGTVPTMNADSAASRNHSLRGVTGGSLPATIWREFMQAATAGTDQGSFRTPTSFPGRVLNEALDTTTTTESTTTTELTATATTEKATTTSGPTTSSSTTSTTKPPGSTSTTGSTLPPIN